MAKLRAFQYLVLKHPDADNDEDKSSSEILLDGSKEILMANNTETAMIQVARKIPEAELANLDRIEFLVRPF